MDKVVWPVCKSLVLIIFWYVMYINEVTKTVGTIATLALIIVYQYVVALLFGLKVMKPMDQACFISSSKSNINFVSVSFFDGNFDEKWFEEVFKKGMIARFEKLSYRVVMKFGDLYYEDIND